MPCISAPFFTHHKYIFQSNKTETYVTGYEYEPLFSKEEISNMDNEIALFIYELERGYMQCIQG